MFSSETLFFLGFAVFVLFVMSLDLGVFSSKKARQSHVIGFKEAAMWSAIWVALSLAFYLFLRQFGYLVHGITDMAQLQEVRDRYADHVELTAGTFAENLTIFQKIWDSNTSPVIWWSTRFRPIIFLCSS